MKNVLSQIIFSSAMLLLFAAGECKGQKSMTLRAVGNGEKVKIAVNGKSKIVRLENDFASDFTAGGAPHRFTTLLSIQKDGSFYLAAKFISEAAISDKNAPCGGDIPATLLLIQANKNLAIEKIQTEIYQSCAFNGSGREIKGKSKVNPNGILINFDEGSKKYVLIFDAREAEKGLQLRER